MDPSAPATSAGHTAETTNFLAWRFCKGHPKRANVRSSHSLALPINPLQTSFDSGSLPIPALMRHTTQAKKKGPLTGPSVLVFVSVICLRSYRFCKRVIASSSVDSFFAKQNRTKPLLASVEFGSR